MCANDVVSWNRSGNSRNQLVMDSEELQDLAEDPRFISGIYNYCDRWCERCPFSTRCLLYAMEKADDADDPADRDLNNEAFWKKLHQTFEMTKEMLLHMAQEQGIDLSKVDEQEVAKRAARREQSKSLQPAPEAERYLKMVDQWFDSEKKLFQEKGKNLASMALMGLEGSDPAGDARDITDAVEIIRWYQHQIYVKLRRALSSEAEDESAEDQDSIQTDANGSVKVALIGIDRSIAAWAGLQAHFTDKADAILDILVHLDRLRRKAEERFPHARKFKRAGFDD